jgi:hypothetical protein
MSLGLGLKDKPLILPSGVSNFERRSLSRIIAGLHTIPLFSTGMVLGENKKMERVGKCYKTQDGRTETQTPNIGEQICLGVEHLMMCAVNSQSSFIHSWLLMLNREGLMV